VSINTALNPALRSQPVLSRTQTIDKACLELLYKQTPTVLFGVVTTVSYLTFCLYGHVDHRMLFIWLGGYCGLLLVRFIACQLFIHRRDLLVDNSWKNVAIASSLASGLLTGSIFLLFFVTDPPHLLVISIIIVIAMVANAVASLSSIPSAYLAFTLPVMTMMIGRVMVESSDYQLLTVNGIIFLITVLLFSRTHFKSIIESITLRIENKALLENLTELKDIAEAANIDKSRFLAAASHDLRQPVHALGLLLEALESRADGKPEDLFFSINKSVGNLKELFDALLDISRLDAGTVDTNLCHFSLTQLLADLETDYPLEARREGVNFNIAIGESEVIYSDPILLKRVISNLLNNAIRYTEQGSISINVEKRQNTFLLAVNDTGCGIKEEDQREIFLEFFQVDNPERDRNNGLGLGLAIAKRISKLLSFNIRLESSLGIGSTFTLELESGDPSEVVIAQPPSTYTEQNFNGLKVLIIDDEADVLGAMTSTLNEWGCTVFQAQSAEEALNNLTQIDEPDMIVADYRLRENNTGTQAIESIRLAAKRNIPALIVTGDTAPERIQQARESDFMILHKPVRPAQLRLAMKHCLDESTV
jgi:two-component system, sensor histidine kinase